MQDDGRTQREHLESIERQTGEVQFDRNEPPETVEYLWKWFGRLSARRQNGMGPNPIGWDQIEAFFKLHGIAPDYWELRALECLDNAWLSAQAKKEKQTPRKKR